MLPVPHKEIWFVDTEYQRRDGEQDQRDICLVAHEHHSGRTIKLWEDELHLLRCAPFDVGPDSIIVVYGAFAELGTFRSLGWPAPCRVLDLFPEFKRQTNDGPHKSGSLLSALIHFGLPHMSVADKEANRRLIMDQSTWTMSERRRIIDYCASDVFALQALLPALLPDIDNIAQAFGRSDYMCTMDAIGRVGIPIDVPALQLIQQHWEAIRGRILADVDQQYGTYPDGKWSEEGFENYLDAEHILPFWPRTEKTGKLQADQQTFKEMALIFPQLNLLREARGSLGKVRPVDLDIGSDGRCRSALFPFGTITGRNAPRRFLFSPAIWIRSLIRSEPGRAIAYCDYSGQELAIAAAFSNDENMMCAYRSGDFYLATAKAFGIAPPEATEESHPAARELCKTLSLGLNYGMMVWGLAQRLDIGYAEAEALIAKHRATYPKFWEFSDAVTSGGMLNCRLTSVFGWSYQVTGETNPRSLRNWPMQAAGAEMLRLATIALVAAGVSVSALVHDAILIEAPERDIAGHVEATQALMARAGEVVTGGFPLRVAAKVFTHGHRYRDKRGIPMWNRVARMLQAA
jgi:DNA polymerase family A